MTTHSLHHMFVADDFTWFGFLSNILYVDYSHAKH